MSNNTLAGGGVGVRIEESTDGGIIISGLEIIEPGLYFSAGAKSPFLTTFSAVSNHANLLLNYTKIPVKSQHTLVSKIKRYAPIRRGASNYPHFGLC